MNPLKTLAKFFTKEKIISDIPGLVEEGWKPLSGTYEHYKKNDYENSFASISKIANGFLMIEPYTVNREGNSIPSNVLDRIYNPNNQMSAADFREALAVMSLVHKKVNIRVHHRGNRITADSITGFTFIENYFEYITDGKRHFQLPSGKVVTEDEVISLKNVNPYDLSEGFSPSDAARKWIRLDDYIAAYQAGFFKNGAVPAGQFIITARTVQDFRDIKQQLERKHQGVGKNNNVSYSYRPVDDNGKQQQAQIEWVPFNVQNKDMALKDLFEQANKKIDSAFGVPASIRGVNDSNTYASVRVDEVIFTKYVLSPIAMKIWSKFTHELNRITGGTGVSISYDLDIPTIAEEEKIKAEYQSIEAQTIINLQNAGYSLSSIVEALDLHADYNLLTPAEVTETEEDNVEVTDEEDLRDTPNQPDKDNPTLYNEHLKSSKNVTPEVRSEYEQLMFDVAQNQLQRQIDGVTEQDLSKQFEADEDEVEVFTDEMLFVLSGLIALEGAKQRALGVSLVLQAGLDTTNIRNFNLTAEQRDQYRSYLLQVANSYTTTNATLIRTILDRSSQQGLSFGQVREQLRTLVDEGYQATRLARTEVSRAASEASVYAMENIADQTGYSIVKVWNINPGACEYCQAMNGREETVSSSFVPLDSTVTGVDGGELINNFTDIHDTTLHPNCSCFATYEVRG